MLCDEVISVVMDIGSLNARCGYSGDDTPRYQCLSKVGVNVETIQDTTMEVEREKNMYGDEALYKRRDDFEIRDIIRNGLIPNYDSYEGLIDHCYKRVLAKPSDYSLMLANNFSSRLEREKVTELIFESVGVPNLFMIRNCVLSAFSAGRSTALVLDIGAYQTTAIAVHEGYGMLKTQQTFPIGGETLTQLYLKDLQNKYQFRDRLRYQMEIDSEGQQVFRSYKKTHPSYHEYQMLELVRDIKESNIMISDAQSQTNPQPQKYEMPDGSSIEISAESIYKISGSLYGEDYKFLTSNIGNNLIDFKGVHQMVMDSINASNTDIKSQLCSTILTTGGSTGIQGWHQSLTNRLSSNGPSMCKVKLVSYPSQTNRQHSVFIGGSILSSLSSFQSMWVTSAEYKEIGHSIIDRKCPM